MGWHESISCSKGWESEILYCPSCTPFGVIFGSLLGLRNWPLAISRDLIAFPSKWDALGSTYFKRLEIIARQANRFQLPCSGWHSHFIRMQPGSQDSGLNWPAHSLLCRSAELIKVSTKCSCLLLLAASAPLEEKHMKIAIICRRCQCFSLGKCFPCCLHGQTNVSAGWCECTRTPTSAQKRSRMI